MVGPPVVGVDECSGALYCHQSVYGQPDRDNLVGELVREMKVRGREPPGAERRVVVPTSGDVLVDDVLESGIGEEARELRL